MKFRVQWTSAWGISDDVVDLDSADDFRRFSEKHGHDLILKFDPYPYQTDGVPIIEVYDDYRE